MACLHRVMAKVVKNTGLGGRLLRLGKPADLPPNRVPNCLKLASILIVIVNLAYKTVHGIRYGLMAGELGEHRQIFVVFESFADQFETDALHRNVCSSADNIRA